MNTSNVFFRILPCLLLSSLTALASEALFHSDQANHYEFSPQPARFVRVLIHATSGPSQPCLDEIEVYGSDPDRNLALTTEGGKASASSCLLGYAIHQIPNLNDGLYGNAHSWVAAGTGEEWVQIELSEPLPVSRVTLSRDRRKEYGDRIPIRFDIQVSLDGTEWQSVKKVETSPAPVALQPRPAAGPGIPAPLPPPGQEAEPGIAEEDTFENKLAWAYLAQEHAWLKTYGRADLDPSLVPYNGRVKEYPRHVGEDVLPLPLLSSPPRLDGRLDDPCWREASRGTTQVAFLKDPDTSPCVTTAVWAGRFEDKLCVAIQTDLLLSRHVAVLSTGEGMPLSLLLLDQDKLILNVYGQTGSLETSGPIPGGQSQDLRCFEVVLPLATWQGDLARGLKIGVGMGGRHTPAGGRSILFRPSNLFFTEEPNPEGRGFIVRLGIPPGNSRISLTGNAPGWPTGSLILSGQEILKIQGEEGPIGPEFELVLQEPGQDPYVLHLFRYDPVCRVLDLMENLASRIEGQGLDVKTERDLLDKLNRRHERLSPSEPGPGRELYRAACLAKRQFLFRDPDLTPVRRILFVKRWPFEPSHNYSDFFDAPFRPGGGVYLLDVPSIKGRWAPEQAVEKCVFEADTGIARNPVASPDLSQILFAYRPSSTGTYHLMKVYSNGGHAQQMTEGPFQDYWPCPLPDGGLAFISTRCTCRALCWRPQAAVLYRMEMDGSGMRPLSLAGLTEWAPSIMRDGRILWTRWEYLDKGADFGHTLWAIHTDGSHPELVFGNTILQPNGYANGREVPGTQEICCTLISHFGDLNGPIALLDIGQGRFNPKAITSITPEVPWPGNWPRNECFREPFPLSKELFLCSHASRDRFDLFLIDRSGNRELVYADPSISSMCPTLFSPTIGGPVSPDMVKTEEDRGEFILTDVNQGLAPEVPRGKVKYVRVVEEVRSPVKQLSDGDFQRDHEPFMLWYASPVDLVSGPYGWPAYVAKAPWGTVPVSEDGSARFFAPSGRTLYFQALDESFNEIQRMRSVVQVQPGEKRSCIGCHENRSTAPPVKTLPEALGEGPKDLTPPSWGAGPFSYETAVQPVLDRRCVQCHTARHRQGVDLTGVLDENKIPASYRTLVSQGWIHYVDCGWNSGGCEKLAPLSFGTVKSRLWDVLNKGHHRVNLSLEEQVAIKTWTDLNCPLWPGYGMRVATN